VNICLLFNICTIRKTTANIGLTLLKRDGILFGLYKSNISNIAIITLRLWADGILITQQRKALYVGGQAIPTELQKETFYN
jgi:hypothetical protein